MPAENEKEKQKVYYAQKRYPLFFDNIDVILSMLSRNPGKELKEFYSSGDKAALRRIRPKGPEQKPSPFWRLLSRYGVLQDMKTGARTYLTPEEEVRWAAVIQGMAMTADLCCGAKVSFAETLGRCETEGDALANRFDQLLRATPERFIDLLRYMLKIAMSKERAFSWVELAALLLTPFEDERHELLSRFAQSFYLAREKTRYISNKD